MLSKPATTLLTLWRSRQNGREIPNRSAFRPEEFGPWMPNIVICDVEGPPQRFRLRLIGDAVRRLDDRDYTGWYLDECLTSPLRETVVGQWALCAAERKPVAVRHRALTSLGFEIEIEKLFLPMATSAAAVGQVFGLIIARGAWYAGTKWLTLHEVETDGSSEVVVLRDDVPADGIASAADA